MSKRRHRTCKSNGGAAPASCKKLAHVCIDHRHEVAQVRLVIVAQRTHARHVTKAEAAQIPRPASSGSTRDHVTQPQGATAHHLLNILQRLPVTAAAPTSWRGAIKEPERVSIVVQGRGRGDGGSGAPAVKAT